MKRRALKQNSILCLLIVILFIGEICAFNVIQVKAEYSKLITIKNDGTIDPPTAPMQRNGNVYLLTANVTLGSDNLCLIQKSNIIIDGNGFEVANGYANTVFIFDWSFYCFNVSIRNMIIKNCTSIIEANGSDGASDYIHHMTLSNNRFVNGRIRFWWTDSINVSDNEFIGSMASLDMDYVSNCTISRNKFADARSLELGHLKDGVVSDNTLISSNKDYPAINVYTSKIVTIKGNNLLDCSIGIQVSQTSSCLISQNNASKLQNYAINVNECTGTVISKNILKDSKMIAASGGINAWTSNCTIYENVILNNVNGISIGIPYPDVVPYCRIYGNHIINNTYQARVFAVQTPPVDAIVWDDGYPAGGNYWSDYVGVDLNHDGMGDSPYVFPALGYGWYGGRDRFPLVGSPYYGPIILEAFYNYSISPDFEVIFNASLSYASNSTIMKYEWDFGDGTNGVGKIVTHKYDSGIAPLITMSALVDPTYSATLKVTDDKGLTKRATRTIAKGNIEIRSASPVQVYEYGTYGSQGNDGTPLIRFKDTSFNVKYYSSFSVAIKAHVKLEATGFSPDTYEFDYEFQPSYGNLDLWEDITLSPIFIPTQKTTAKYRIIIDPYNTLPETVESDNSFPTAGSKEVKVDATEPLRILFVPVRFKNEDGYPGSFRGFSRGDFIEHAVESAKYIEETYPVPNIGLTTGASGVSYDCSCFNSPITVKDENGQEVERPTTKDEAEKTFKNLARQLAAKAGYNYDRVVGIVRTNWFVGIPDWSTTDGYNWGGIPFSVVVTLGNWGVTPHEIGHTYNLNHTNDRVSPYAPPYYIKGRIIVNNAQTWMATGAIPYPPAEPTFRRPLPYFWVLGREYMHLFSEFRNPFDPEILFINSDFSKNGTATINNCYRYPTGFPMYLETDTGNYSIVQLNSLNTVLSVVGFNVTYENLVCNHPEILPSTVSLSFTIPYASSTKTIQIRDQLGNVVASKSVSVNTPTIRVISPNGGQVLKSETTQVSWEAADLDGDPLTYDLLVSDDGGSTWDPVATGLKQTNHNLIVTGFSGGNKYLVKVIACDGVNTAEDVSDSYFTVASFSASMVSVPQSVSKAGNSAFYLLNLTSYGGFSDQITLNATSSSTTQLNFIWDEGNRKTPVVNGSTYILLEAKTLNQIESGNHTLYLSGTSGSNSEVAVTYLYVEPSSTVTPTPTPTPSPSPSPTPTPSPSPSPTASPTPTPSPSPTPTVSPSPTPTSPPPTSNPTTTLTSPPTTKPTATPTQAPTPTPTQTIKPTFTPQPTATPQPPQAETSTIIYGAIGAAVTIAALGIAVFIVKKKK